MKPFRGVLRELDGSGSVRKQARCSAHITKPVASIAQLYDAMAVVDSRREDFGPRQIVEEERLRREALYPPMNPERLKEIREQGWRSSVTYMLLNQGKKKRALGTKSHIIRRAFKQYPEMSNNEIAKLLGFKDSLVHNVREREKKGDGNKTVDQIAAEVGCSVQFVEQVRASLAISS